MAVSFTTAAQPFITMDNAKAYAAQTDKWLWVVYNILDEIEFEVSDARVNWVEDRLEALLAA